MNKTTSVLRENEEGRESSGVQNLQGAKLRYIVINSRMYEIFEDELSVKVCRE